MGRGPSARRKRRLRASRRATRDARRQRRGSSASAVRPDCRCVAAGQAVLPRPPGRDRRRQARVVTVFNVKGEMQTTAPEEFMAQSAIDRLLRDVDIEKLVGAYKTARGLAGSVEFDPHDDEGARRRQGAGQHRKAQWRGQGHRRVAAGGGRWRAILRLLPAPKPRPRPQRRAPPARSGRPPQPGPAVPGAFATLADIDAALGAAHGYFLRAEPTSPAVLLIRQARQTLGKNLYEVMQLLAPKQADEARVFVGPNGTFPVPVRNLADAPTLERRARRGGAGGKPSGGDRDARRGRPAHAEDAAFEPGALSARARQGAGDARLRQPAQRHFDGGRRSTSLRKP